MNTEPISDNELRKELVQLMYTLKNNKSKVPLDVLKTRYKQGYSSLCQSLRRTASEYARRSALGGIRIHKNYETTCAEYLNHVIKESGCLYRLSCIVFQEQDITAFDTELSKIRELILSELDKLCLEHLYIYILEGDIWIPLWEYRNKKKKNL